jgi:aspartyl-tRNA synthetase
MGDYNTVKVSLGALRCKLARELDLIKKGDYKLLWVTDFPSFEWSEEEGRYLACHHPFTMTKDSDVDKLLTDKAHCYSKAYDIVINGYEAGGGSIRIHDEKVQETMFKALELTEDDIKRKFGLLPNKPNSINLKRFSSLKITNEFPHFSLVIRLIFI